MTFSLSGHVPPASIPDVKVLIPAARLVDPDMTRECGRSDLKDQALESHAFGSSVDAVFGDRTTGGPECAGLAEAVPLLGPITRSDYSASGDGAPSGTAPQPSATGPWEPCASNRRRKRCRQRTRREPPLTTS